MNRAHSATDRDPDWRLGGPYGTIELMRRPRLPRRIPRSLPILDSPLVRRVLWHLQRMRGQLDRRFFLSLAQGIVGFVLIAAVLITMFEKSWTFESVFDSFNWGIATVLGQGDSGYVTSPAGRLISWFLILFGVAMLGMITGALVAMVIDFLLKEGQGLGASGYKDHIVVCGWNTTARDLIAELRGDD
jgi:voltage-gated potassium channel